MVTKEKLPMADIQHLEGWLRENDSKMFLVKTRIGEARKRYMEKFNVRVSAKQFAESRKVCRYWKQIPRRTWTSSPLLSEEQWSQIRAWVDRNVELIKSVESIDLMAYVMRARGLPASRRILEGSCSFMAVWKRFHPQG